MLNKYLTITIYNFVGYSCGHREERKHDHIRGKYYSLVIEFTYSVYSRGYISTHPLVSSSIFSTHKSFNLGFLPARIHFHAYNGFA